MELEMAEPKIHMTMQGTKNSLGQTCQTWWEDLFYLVSNFILKWNLLKLWYQGRKK